MSAPALAGIAPTPAPSAAPRAGSRGGAEDFARMLQGASAREQPDRSNGGGRTDAAPPSPHDPDTGAPPPAADAEPAPDPGTAPSPAPADTRASDAAEADAEAPQPGAWPPPGLGWLLQPPPQEAIAIRSQPGAPSGLADGPSRLQPLPAPATAPAVAAAAAVAAAPGDVADAAAMEPATSEDLVQAAGLARTASAGPAADAAAPTFVLPALPAAPAAGPAPVQAGSTAAHLPTPNLGAPGFADEVGSHVQWAAGQKIGHAVIRIAPDDLGPVEVRLHLDGDRLSADFSSAQVEVRQALEQGIGRLREMLGAHGFELAHAGVDQGHGGSHGQAPSARKPAGGGDGAEPEPVRPEPVLRRRGLLDAYA